MDIIRGFQATPIPGLIWRLRQGTLRLLKPFRLGVRIAVIDPEERVLLIRHSYRPGWHLPGGGVHKWETLEDAAIRETREETGVVIQRLDRLVGVYANFGIGYCDHVALFTATDWRPGPHRSVEVAEARFFPADAIPPDTTPPTRRRLADVMDNASPDPHW